VGPDADAHVYEPSPADAKRLAQADLVVINGLAFEGWIERMVKVSGYRGTVVVASQGIQPRAGGHHGTDPHAWQDLALARRYAANLSTAFAQRWPEQRDEIARGVAWTTWPASMPGPPGARVAGRRATRPAPRHHLARRLRLLRGRLRRGLPGAAGLEHPQRSRRLRRWRA
jgi:hypothetical protein